MNREEFASLLEAQILSAERRRDYYEAHLALIYLTHGKRLPEAGDRQVFVDSVSKLPQAVKNFFRWRNAFLQGERIQGGVFRPQLGLHRLREVRAAQQPLIRRLRFLLADPRRLAALLLPFQALEHRLEVVDELAPFPRI